jgi:hypothetical protein
VLGFHWRAPAVAGTYFLTVRAPFGFDALSPATLSCRAN